MKLDVTAVNVSRSHIAITYSNGKLVRAVLPVVHVHREGHSAASRDFRGAGKSRMISSYHQTGDRFGLEGEASRRVGVVEEVFNPPAWLLNMEAEASLSIVVNCN